MEKRRLLLTVCFICVGATSVTAQGITPGEAASKIISGNDIAQLVQSINDDPDAFKDYIGDTEEQRTLLIMATIYQRTTVASALIDAGSDVDFLDINAGTALTYAIGTGDAANTLTTSLLDAGANVDLPLEPFWSPLHIAARTGNSFILQSILDKSPDVNREDFKGRTALTIAAEYRHNLFQMLIDAGADPDHENYDGSTALTETIRDASSYNIDEWNTRVDALLAGGANPDFPEPPLWGPLQYACDAGHSYMIRALIEAGADVNRTDSGRNFCLMIAARRRETVLSTLLDRGAYVDQQDYWGRTALVENFMQYYSSYAEEVNQNFDALMDANANIELPHAPAWGPLHEAAYRGANYIVSSLIEANATVNRLNNLGNTPLIIAAEQEKNVLVALIEGGADVDHMNYFDDTAMTKLIKATSSYDLDTNNILLDDLLDGNASVHLPRAPAWGPLHYAAEDGFRYMIESLIEAGAEVDRRDSYGKSPLIIAAEEGKAVVQTLIDAGADVDLQDNGGHTALVWGLSRFNYGTDEVRLGNMDALLSASANVHLPEAPFWTPLFYAAEEDTKYATQKLLEAGSDVERQDFLGQTPLHIAARHSARSVIDPLIEADSDVNYLDYEGQTPMIAAARYASSDEAPSIVNDLLEGNANPNLRVSTSESALHYAAKRSTTATAQILLENGASVTAIDDEGYTPLMSVLDGYSYQRLAFITLFLRGGSDINHLSYQDGTVIHRLVSYSDDNALAYAMLFCPNLELRNGNNQTPLELAESRGDEDIAKILEAEYESRCVFNLTVYNEGQVRCTDTTAYICNSACEWEETSETTNCTFVTPPQPVTCSSELDPVCASTGITYQNECYLNLAAAQDPTIQLSHNGHCESITTPGTPDPYCKQECIITDQPVCGSNGLTYINLCVFQNAQCDYPYLTVAHEGACVTTPCTTSCTEQYEPVCGSDDVTYSNECYFNNAKCEKPYLTIAYYGACGSPTNCDVMCMTTWDPVCATNGITYPNDCFLSAVICKDPSISKQSDGECPGGNNGGGGGPGPIVNVDVAVDIN